jgi:hypothetical protein
MIWWRGRGTNFLSSNSITLNRTSISILHTAITFSCTIDQRLANSSIGGISITAIACTPIFFSRNVHVQSLVVTQKALKDKFRVKQLTTEII